VTEFFLENKILDVLRLILFTKRNGIVSIILKLLKHQNALLGKLRSWLKMKTRNFSAKNVLQKMAIATYLNQQSFGKRISYSNALLK
jgi:hypothetical protein